MRNGSLTAGPMRPTCLHPGAPAAGMLSACCVPSAAAHLVLALLRLALASLSTGGGGVTRNLLQDQEDGRQHRVQGAGQQEYTVRGACSAQRGSSVGGGLTGHVAAMRCSLTPPGLLPLPATPRPQTWVELARAAELDARARAACQLLHICTCSAQTRARPLKPWAASRQWWPEGWQGLCCAVCLRLLFYLTSQSRSPRSGWRPAA